MAAGLSQGPGSGVTEPGSPAVFGSPGPPAPPGSSGPAQAQGAGTQSLRWTVRSGDWMVVVMNPDGAPGVTVRADVGVSSPALPALASALLVAGLTAGLIGAALVVIPARLAAGRR